jgi:hypothetical protein
MAEKKLPTPEPFPNGFRVEKQGTNDAVYPRLEAVFISVEIH